MITLVVKPDGTVQGPYTELIDLAALGRLSIQRATSVEFDNASQKWQVFTAMGQQLYAHPSRQECLRWEQEYLSK